MGTGRCCCCEGCSSREALPLDGPLMGEGLGGGGYGVARRRSPDGPSGDGAADLAHAIRANIRTAPSSHCGLTAAWNACHQSYDRTMIVIRPRTAAAPFPDQD